MAELESIQIPWREPWKPLSETDAQEIEAELHREICTSHVLFGRFVKAVGYHMGSDNFLFCLKDTAAQVAVVHLTFRQESDPNWPHTELFDDLKLWIEQRLTPDAEEYSL